MALFHRPFSLPFSFHCHCSGEKVGSVSGVRKWVSGNSTLLQSSTPCVLVDAFVRIGTHVTKLMLPQVNLVTWSTKGLCDMSCWSLNHQLNQTATTWQHPAVTYSISQWRFLQVLFKKVDKAGTGLVPSHLKMPWICKKLSIFPRTEGECVWKVLLFSPPFLAWLYGFGRGFSWGFSPHRSWSVPEGGLQGCWTRTLHQGL